jgi:DNA invertase Pin-like site-specific DNA recombinase
LVVTKLDRLARSVSDAHDIAKELTARRRLHRAQVISRDCRW